MGRVERYLGVSCHTKKGDLLVRRLGVFWLTIRRTLAARLDQPLAEIVLLDCIRRQGDCFAIGRGRF